MKRFISKFFAFFTTVPQHTRSPISEEDWALCYKSHGEQIKGFEGLELSMEQFQAMDRALGSKTKITVSDDTPLAFFYNTKRLIFKLDLPHRESA